MRNATSPQPRAYLSILPDRWIALCLLLAMLGQSIMPTLAYTWSGSEPGLWNEICSIYGVRSDAIKTPGDRTPNHHADCPLCLHVFSDTILATSSIANTFHLLFLNEIVLVVNPTSFVNFFPIVPAARGPPQFN
jgi:hypothetical protein